MQASSRKYSLLTTVAAVGLAGCGAGGLVSKIQTTGTSPLELTATNSSSTSTLGVQSLSTTSSTSTSTSGTTSTSTSGSYAHVDVTFDQLQVHYDGAADPTNTNVATASDTDPNWVTVPMASGSVSETVDLMNLTQGGLLGNATLQNGTYTQIRLEVTSADVVDGTGATSSLEVPSGELKIIKPFLLKPGFETSLGFDFDTAHCIVSANGTYWMNPTAVQVAPTYAALPVPNPSP